mgnify:CR=1 FL=1
MKILAAIFAFIVSFSVSAQTDTVSKSDYTLPTLAFMGLPKVEISTNFSSASIYGGYGFYTTYLITGNVGLEVNFDPGEKIVLGPKFSLGYVLIGEPGLNVQVSLWAPIKENQFDLVLNPQIGTGYFLGIFYLIGGYNFNLTRRTNFQDSFNLTLGMQIPLNIEKFVDNI